MRAAELLDIDRRTLYRIHERANDLSISPAGAHAAYRSLV